MIDTSRSVAGASGKRGGVGGEHPDGDRQPGRSLQWLDKTWALMHGWGQ